MTKSTNTELIELARQVVNLLNKSESGDATAQMASDMARTLAAHASVTVRRALVNELQRCRYIPKDLAVAVAKDAVDVAEPFLVSCRSIEEEALELIVRTCKPYAAEAIATREGITEPVSFAITEVGTAKAVVNLMENETAEISDRVCQQAVARYGQSDTVPDAMATRQDLPLAIVDDLLHLVSATYKEMLLKSYDLGEDHAAFVTQVTEQAAFVESLDKASDDELQAYFKALRERGELNQMKLLMLLQEGSSKPFCHAVAIASDEEFKSVDDIYRRGSVSGLEKLLANAGVGKHLFGVFEEAFLNAR